MGKMIIVDDEGTTEEFNQFMAVGVKENGQIMRMVEDEGIEYQASLGCMLAMTKLLGEMAEAIMPDQGDKQ
ncbi:hypothetical protein ES703_61791 [subsurface metagenome]